MDMNEVLGRLRRAIEDYDAVAARESASDALGYGLSPMEIIDGGLAPGMGTVSDQFNEGTCYLPQLVAAAKAMEAALKVLEPAMSTGDGPRLEGVIVMGSVRGDIHEIGKDVCCAMLRGAGFKVIDLGSDVTPDEFAAAIAASSADVVGASALMTTSLYQQKDLVRVLREDRISVLKVFGGAPCTQEWVDEIGGDGYSATGAEIVPLVRRLLGGDDEGRPPTPIDRSCDGSRRSSDCHASRQSLSFNST